MTGKNLDRLQKLQYKSARIIHCKPPSTHITPLLNELHWLPVRERIHHKALTLVYKCLHNLSPNYLTNLLKVRQSNYNTRSSSRTPLHTPRTYKSVGDQAFTAFAPKLWNNLPVNLKECTSISTFKRCSNLICSSLRLFYELSSICTNVCFPACIFFSVDTCRLGICIVYVLIIFCLFIYSLCDM